MRLRKMAAIIIMGVLLITTLGLTGCGFQTKRNLKKVLEKALQGRYNEEFVCLNVWANGGPSYFGVCYPKNNRDLLFEILFIDDGEISYDEYASMLASKELSKELYNQLSEVFQECYIYCYNYKVINDTVTAEKINSGEFNLDYFFETMHEQSDDDLSLYYRICINKESGISATYEEEYKSLNKATQEIMKIGENHGVKLNLTFWLYFLPSDVYKDGIEYFNNHARARSEFEYIILGEYRNLKREIRMDYDENIKPFSRKEFEPMPITQKDYVEMRKSLE
ncbi:MAG: hypothetical protein HFK00_08855 [Oscillospiraceae bacterium]|nr:hypothetical protein [Oscillospiraceae bacterium]